MTRLISLVVLTSLLASSAPSTPAQETITKDELAAIKAAEEARIRAIDSVYGSVVAIYGNDRAGGGSGVLYDASGLALTNHHVVAGAGVEGWAGLADGKLYRWKLIGTDPGGDVAIIQLLGKDQFPVAPLGNSDNVRVGDFSMAMGNPFILAEDQRPTVTLGIVSGIERYQEGAGNNMLVYGNCIQVDSSINPGNSGGPLFNIQGEVIGINGRGSFKERGRVNVGLGYAISINQIKYFLPDLLATKMVQHGTLDAVFGNRGGEVICHTINLDSQIAKLGLGLGDKLIAFEGQKVASANQFTNVITTLPAGWPCEVTFEHEGQVRTVHVRLTPLPYGPKQAPMPMPMPKEEDKPKEEKKEGDKPAEEKPAEDKPAEDKKEGDKPAEEKKPDEEEKKPDEKKPDDKPMPVPMIRLPMPKPPNFGDAGEVRDKALNMENAKRVIGRWQAFTVSQEAQAAAGWTATDQITRGDDAVGKQTLTIARDGRFRVEVELDGKVNRFGHDGKEFWSQDGDEEPAVIDAERLCRNPFAGQAYTLAAVLTKEPLATIGKVEIDAGDKANKKIAYRLKAMDAETDEFFVWLSVLDDAGLPEVRLLKTCESPDDERTAAMVYDDWKLVGSLKWPHAHRVVAGLGETLVVKLATQSIEAQSDFPETTFQKPGHETK